MSQAAKKHLDGTLHHYAEQHGLDDLVYGSFFRHLGALLAMPPLSPR